MLFHLERYRSLKIIGAFLAGLGVLYRFALAFRHYLYDRQWLYTYKAPAFVVSIGNIVCGGTGKTPLIQRLVQDLKAMNSIAVVARAYKACAENSKKTVNVSALYRQGKADPNDVGDEPYIIAATTHAEVFVSDAKWKSAKYAAEQGFSLIIVDDGMQHRRLHKDIEVVIIDARDPLGGGMLPKGNLRDIPSRLAYADLIVVCNAEQAACYTSVEKLLRFYTNAPVVQMKRNVSVQADITTAPVGLFCGIAKPKYFQKAIEELGASIVATLFTPDHEVPSIEELASFALLCRSKGAKLLVCTEKDFVKLPKDLALTLEVIPAYLELEMGQGAYLWQDLLEQCKNLKKRKKL